MNKKTLLAGVIVLAIGIVLFSMGDQFSLIDNPSHLISEFVVGSFIIGGLLLFAGIILLIYGALLPDPPIHYDNNL
jgi:hypothetical protein